MAAYCSQLLTFICETIIVAVRIINATSVMIFVIADCSVDLTIQSCVVKWNYEQFEAGNVGYNTTVIYQYQVTGSCMTI